MRKIKSAYPYPRRLARVRDDRERIVRDFHKTVNMTARRLQAWLDTDESHEVGFRRAPGEESVGHRSGRSIVRILRTSPAKLSDEDLLHMRTVIGYIRRHLAQRPFKDIATSRWAYSLKNWGHDPTKKSSTARISASLFGKRP